MNKLKINSSDINSFKDLTKYLVSNELKDIVGDITVCNVCYLSYYNVETQSIDCSYLYDYMYADIEIKNIYTDFLFPNIFNILKKVKGIELTSLQEYISKYTEPPKVLDVSFISDNVMIVLTDVKLKSDIPNSFIEANNFVSMYFDTFGDIASKCITELGLDDKNAK